MIPDSTITLVKKYEGYRSRPYLCLAGKLTIGYGHTATVTRGMTVTRAAADKLLLHDLRAASEHLDRLVVVPLTENQRAALLSFMFNVGPTRFATSTLRKLLNQSQYDAVPEQLRRWVWATDRTTGKKRKVTWLVSRRDEEARLWAA